MKKIKVLLSTVAIVAMLASVCFAASSAVGFTTDGSTTMEYTNNGTDLVISLYSLTDATIMGGGYFRVQYDSTAWTYEGPTFVADYSAGDAKDQGGIIEVCLDGGKDKGVTTNGKLVDLTFSVKDDTKIDGSVFEFVDDGNYWDSEMEPIAYSGTLTVNVASSKPDDPTVDGSGAVTEVVDEATKTTYKNVFVGNYSITPAEGETLATIGIKFVPADNLEATPVVLSVDKTFDGAGKVTFSAAMIGIPEGKSVVGTPFGTYVAE